jgi:hypothetical protein
MCITHTLTHTHILTQRERERERIGIIMLSWMLFGDFIVTT